MQMVQRIFIDGLPTVEQAQEKATSATALVLHLQETLGKTTGKQQRAAIQAELAQAREAARAAQTELNRARAARTHTCDDSEPGGRSGRTYVCARPLTRTPRKKSGR
jgi:hypothetical protein